jgi:hypothetical protein
VKPTEHYREAERLLKLAAVPAYLVTLPDNVTAETAERIEQELYARGLTNAIVHPESIKIDPSGLLAAAQVHATLALAGSQMWGDV